MVFDKNSVDIPGRLRRYWNNRYLFFSRFDQGIRLDEQAFYSVKPEILAARIARRLKGRRIFDAFCGAGGSAIAFALAGKRVTTCDTSLDRLRLARHNAAIYNVADSIEFVHADMRDVIENISADGMYFDPPWGGIDYRRTGGFRFCHFDPDGRELIQAARARSANIAFSLPRNFASGELSSLACEFELEDAELDGKLWFRNLYVDADARRGGPGSFDES